MLQDLILHMLALLPSSQVATFIHYAVLPLATCAGLSTRHLGMPVVPGISCKLLRGYVFPMPKSNRQVVSSSQSIGIPHAPFFFTP